jgi:hypothetical protein
MVAPGRAGSPVPDRLGGDCSQAVFFCARSIGWSDATLQAQRTEALCVNSVDVRWPPHGPSWSSRRMTAREAGGVMITGEPGRHLILAAGRRWAPTPVGRG